MRRFIVVSSRVGEEKVAKSVFSSAFYDGVVVSSLLDLNLENAAFVYEYLTLFENSTVKKVTLPVRKLKDCTADQIFTLSSRQSFRTLLHVDLNRLFRFLTYSF